jgi:PAS domain S-box-containing protein
VAVVDGYLVHKHLAAKYPDINLLIYNKNESALRAVSSGEAFAFIGSLFSTPVMINKFGLKNLKASAPSPLPEATVSMGIRSDWPELRNIINKAFDTIPESEKTAILNKWSSVKIEYGIRTADVVKWILMVGGGAAGIILLFVFWTRSLAIKVRDRTAELESSKKVLSSEVARSTEAEKLLSESHDYLESLMDSLPDAVFSVTMPERVIEWANDTYQVFGYAPNECVGRTTEFLYPDKQDYLTFGEKIEGAIAEGKEVFNAEQTMRKKGGGRFPVDINVSFF